MATATIPQAERVRRDPNVNRPATLTRHLTAPALLAACGFAIGILVAHVVWITAGWLFVALVMMAAVTGITCAFAPRIAWASAGLLYVVLGCLCTEIAPAVNPQKELILLADNTPRVVQGTVTRLGPLRTVAAASPFSTKTHDEHSQQIDLRLDSPADSTVRLTLYAPVGEQFPQIGCGNRVQATLVMHRQERYLDPGVWDASEYLLQEGVGSLASARPEKFAIVAAGQRGTFSCRLHSLQLTASARLIDFANRANERRMPALLRLNHSDAAMLAAMLTGDRSYLQRGVRVGFERTGSFHLLVVSGLHLAIFSGLIFWTTRRLRLSRPWATTITIGCSLGYAVFTGFGRPVERAFWMVTLYLLGRLLWRERTALNVIGVVALVMLAADPSSLLESGFQMTLLSVLAVAGIAVPVAERTFGPYLFGRCAISGCCASILPYLPMWRSFA